MKILVKGSGVELERYLSDDPRCRKVKLSKRFYERSFKGLLPRPWQSHLASRDPVLHRRLGEGEHDVAPHHPPLPVFKLVHQLLNEIRREGDQEGLRIEYTSYVKIDTILPYN